MLCDSDTQSAPSPTNTLPQTSPSRETTSPSQTKLTSKDARADNVNNIRSTVVKEDYDSSATETADEGVGGTAENESVLQHSSNESEKKDKIVSDLSVSDILSDVIEKQFTKEHSNREVKINHSVSFYVLKYIFVFLLTEREWFNAYHIFNTLRS